MRVLIQVVKEASVSVEGKVIAQIAGGFLLFVGFCESDDEDTMKKTLDKALSLRIFSDAQGKMNLSLEEIGGAVLCVSQFTLYADVKKGRRPSFIGAAKPEVSRPLYEKAVAYIREKGFHCEEGIFGADMKVRLINDGPTTIWIESEDLG